MNEQDTSATWAEDGSPVLTIQTTPEIIRAVFARTVSDFLRDLVERNAAVEQAVSEGRSIFRRGDTNWQGMQAVVQIDEFSPDGGMFFNRVTVYGDSKLAAKICEKLNKDTD